MVDKWKKVKLCEIADVKGGKRLPIGDKLLKEPTDHPYIRVTDMKMGGIKTTDIHFISEDVFRKIKKYVIYSDDIFISVAGSLGIVGIVPVKLNGANLTENADRLTNIKIDRDYLCYYLQSDKIQCDIQNASTVGAQPKLALSRIQQFDILVPKSIEEQKKIVCVLSDITDLINSTSKLIKKKLLIKEGVTEEIFSGKRRLQGFWKKWPENTIEELCYLVTKQTGFDYSAKIKPSLVKSKKEDNIPFIQNKDFEGKRINFLTDFYIPIEVAKKFPQILLDEPSLLISISGRIGNVGMFTDKRLAFIGGAVGVAKFKQKKYIEWVMRYLQSSEGQKKIVINEKTGAQSNITVEDIRKITIPIPSIEEQEAIIAILSDMDEEIFKLEEKLEKYKKIKQGMMEQLLTGKIRLA